MAKTKVDEIFGIPIYFDIGRNKFMAEVSGEKFEADRLTDLKRDINAEAPIEVKEPVVYADGSGEMMLINIVQISPHGWLTPDGRIGFGIPPHPDEKSLFPRIPSNMKLFGKYTLLPCIARGHLDAL